MRHDFAAAFRRVRARFHPLDALSFLMQLQIPRNDLLAAGGTAGWAAKALVILVPAHSVPTISVSALTITAFNPITQNGARKKGTVRNR